MHHRCAGAVFLAVAAQVDAVGVAVVGAHAVVAALVAAAYGQGMLGGEAGACYGVEPVDIASQVNTAVAPAQTYLAVVLCVHHVEFALCEIPCHGA